MKGDMKQLLQMKLERVRRIIKDANEEGEKDKEIFYNGCELGLLSALELVYLDLQ